MAVILAAGLAAVTDIEPARRVTPAAAVAALQEAGAERVFNDYNLGGYLVWAGVPTFIDGRTELFDPDFVLAHHRAVTLADLDQLLRFLDEYEIDATLLVPGSPAVAFLDRQPDWERLHADDVAVVHVRR